MASQGYSFVRNEEDVGAQIITAADVGVVISRTSTFGLPPDVWKTTNCKYAVIPSSFLICRGHSDN